jgi:hypothetical protein
MIDSTLKPTEKQEAAYQYVLSVVKAAERNEPMPTPPTPNRGLEVVVALYEKTLKRCGHKVN